LFRFDIFIAGFLGGPFFYRTQCIFVVYCDVYRVVEFLWLRCSTFITLHLTVTSQWQSWSDYGSWQWRPRRWEFTGQWSRKWLHERITVIKTSAPLWTRGASSLWQN